jgi:hypothetical protein
LTKQEEAYEAMRQRLSRKVREMIEPPSMASKIYPHLKSKADEDQPQGLFHGWGHLKRQQKEK